MRTCAPTGIAASLVQGQTLHSLLGIRAGAAFNPRKKLPTKVLEEHEETMILIIDEVSMLSRSVLASLDAFFRKVKEREVPFGGIMVLFCGDFFQIPPVASEPIYTKPDISKPSVGIQDTIGYQLWQSLDYAIILSESMRQREDEVFSQCLSRVRYGKTTKEDLELLNSRAMKPRLFQDLRQCQAGYVPLVVRSNELRLILNWRMVNSRAQDLRTKPLLCVARIKSLKGGDLCFEDLEILFRTNDTETGNVAVLLPMLPGMPIRITQNVAIHLGIANGTQAVLEGVPFPPQATFDSAQFFGVDCILSDMLPHVVFASSPMFAEKMHRRFPDLPARYTDDTIPLLPTRVDNISANVRRNLKTTQKVTLRQFPFVPAYASTTYKIQGTTTAGIIAFPIVRECRIAPPRAALYVILSRVRSLSSLFLIEKLSEDDLKYFSPTKELLEEEKRLKELHCNTVAAMDSKQLSSRNENRS